MRDISLNLRSAKLVTRFNKLKQLLQTSYSIKKVNALRDTIKIFLSCHKT